MQFPRSLLGVVERLLMVPVQKTAWYQSHRREQCKEDTYKGGELIKFVGFVCVRFLSVFLCSNLRRSPHLLYLVGYLA